MTHHVQDCHWSVPTLLMPRPYWLSASDNLWSCWNSRDIRVLHSTDRCHTCPMWRQRAADDHAGHSLPPDGAVPCAEER